MADVTWTGATDGDISNGDNWDTASPPTTGDDAIFGGGGSNEPSSGSIDCDLVRVIGAQVFGACDFSSMATAIVVDVGVSTQFSGTTIGINGLQIRQGASVTLDGGTTCAGSIAGDFTGATGHGFATLSVTSSTVSGDITDIADGTTSSVAMQVTLVASTVSGTVSTTCGSSTLYANSGSTVGVVDFSSYDLTNVGENRTLTVDASTVSGAITAYRTVVSFLNTTSVTGAVSIDNTSQACTVSQGSFSSTFAYTGTEPGGTFTDDGNSASTVFGDDVSINAYTALFGGGSGYSNYYGDLTVTTTGDPVSVAYLGISGTLSVDSAPNVTPGTVTDVTALSINITRCWVGSSGPVSATAGHFTCTSCQIDQVNVDDMYSLTLTDCWVTTMPAAQNITCTGRVIFLNTSTTAWDFADNVTTITVGAGVVVFLAPSLGAGGFQSAAVGWSSVTSSGAYGLATGFSADGILPTPNYPAAAGVLTSVTYSADTTGTYIPVVENNVRNSVVFGPSGGLGGNMVFPLATQVLNGIGFGSAGTEFTGTVIQPSVGNVRAGTSYGSSSSLTGTLALPTQSNVRDGLSYGAGSTEYTGILQSPAAANVRNGVGFGAAGTQYTGTLVLPDDGVVLFAESFGAAGTEFTGTLVLPDESDVAMGVEYGVDGNSETGTLDPENVDPPAAPAIVGGDITFIQKAKLVITGPAGADIYYSLDGRDPYPPSLARLYTEASYLYRTTEVRAVAVKDGQASEVVRATYTKV